MAAILPIVYAGGKSLLTLAMTGLSTAYIADKTGLDDYLGTKAYDATAYFNPDRPYSSELDKRDLDNQIDINLAKNEIDKRESEKYYQDWEDSLLGQNINSEIDIDENLNFMNYMSETKSNDADFAANLLAVAADKLISSTETDGVKVSASTPNTLSNVDKHALKYNAVGY